MGAVVECGLSCGLGSWGVLTWCRLWCGFACWCAVLMWCGLLRHGPSRQCSRGSQAYPCCETQQLEAVAAARKGEVEVEKRRIARLGLITF